MMRIQLSTTVLSPRKNTIHDGIYIYTRELLAALQQTSQIEIIGNNLPFPTRPRLNNSLWMAASLLNGIPQTWNKDAEIYHSTDYRIPHLKKIPVIATIHDALALRFPEQVNPKLRSLKNQFMRYSTRWLTHAIAISHSIVPDLIEYWGLKENQISVVHCGLNPSWFNKVSDEQRNIVKRKYGLSEKYLLFVGTLQPKKNIDNIISAYSVLNNDLKKSFPLVIVGRKGCITDAEMIQLNNLVASGNGRWLEYVSDEDLPTIYQCATAFIFPSLYEGFGMPVLEAFASGIPVITSNTSSLPEIAGDAALLINPKSVDELNNAMEKLLNSESLRKQLVSAGLLRAREFTWEKSAKEMVKIYKRILGIG